MSNGGSRATLGVHCIFAFEGSTVYCPSASPASAPTCTVQERGQEMLYAPEQISGMVLNELREAAQQHFGARKLVSDAVITVPAYFNDDQRQASTASPVMVHVCVQLDELRTCRQRSYCSGCTFCTAGDKGGCKDCKAQCAACCE